MIPLFGRIPLYSLETFCHRLGIGMSAGVDLLKLIETESRRGSSQHQAIMQQVRENLRGGGTLASSFQATGHYFPPLFIQLISAGETSGKLDRMLAHLASHYQDLRLARRQFLGQIAWPLIQLIMAIGIICLVIAIQGFYTPVAGQEPYDGLGLGLAGTRGVAIFLGWIGIIGILIAGVVIALWKNFFNCHQILIPLILPIPILGSVFSNNAMARMSMTLSMLLNSGVDAIRSVREAFQSTGNAYYIQGMQVALDQIQRGETLAMSLNEAHVFPQEFIDGVEVGELSGSETESLEHLAKEYARRARSSMMQLSVMASVGIWMAIALMIIFFIIRMMMQYVNMLNSLMT